MENAYVFVIAHGNRKIRNPVGAWLNTLAEGARVLIRKTEKAGHATELVRQAIEDGCDRIIAIGGDGTLHETVNGILTSANPAVPCMYLPNGTANDWGKSFAPPVSQAEFLRRMYANPVPVDAGQLSYTSENSRKATRYFINIADTGMGADVVRRVNSSAFRINAHLVFFRAIFSAFFRFRNGYAECRVDGRQVHSGKVRLVVVANGRYFGSGLCISPQSRLNDHVLRVVIIGNVRLLDYLRHLPALRNGKPIRHPEVLYLEGKHIEVKTPELATEADGEFIGSGNVVFNVVPNAIGLL